MQASPPPPDAPSPAARAVTALQGSTKQETSHPVAFTLPVPLRAAIALALLGLTVSLALLLGQSKRDLRHMREQELRLLGQAAVVLLDPAANGSLHGHHHIARSPQVDARLDQLVQRSGIRRIAVITGENGALSLLAEGRSHTVLDIAPLPLHETDSLLVKAVQAGVFFETTISQGALTIHAALLPLSADGARQVFLWIEHVPHQFERLLARVQMRVVLLAIVLLLCLLLPVVVFWHMEYKTAATRRLQLQDKEEERKEAVRHLIETNEDLRRQISARLRTERQLQASEMRFRSLVENSSDFVWEVDAAGCYTYASPKITAILGYQPEEIMGRTPFDFMPAEEAARVRLLFEEIAAEKRPFSGLENSSRHQDGHAVVLETSGEPILDKVGNLLGYRGIDRDISRRKQEEQALREAKELAERADRAKSEFLANMSHELRTPLHAILSFSSFGLKKLDKLERHELEKYFSQINSSGKRLLPLINSLLDLAKLEAGKITYQMQEQDVVPIVTNVLEELRLLAEQKRIDCRLLPPQVATQAYCDQERIGQVLRNLLANALRLSDEDRSIDISLGEMPMPGKPEEPMLCLTVRDEGMGIPKEEVETIFKPFTQSSATRSGAGGTGLGLAICRRIVEDHGGTIWASNNPDRGASFSFTLLRQSAKKLRLGELLVQQGLISRHSLEKVLERQENTQ